MAMFSLSASLLMGQTQNTTADTPASVTASVLLQEKWDGNSTLDWAPSPKIIEQKGARALEINAETANGFHAFSANLPIAKYKGKKLLICTRVKGENVSEKPKSFNGIKLMLMVLNTEGAKDYPQASLPTGTFDWQDVKWSVSIPENAVSARISLGLEEVSGKVWFDSIKIVEQ